MNSKTAMRASAWVWKRRRSSSSHSSGDATPAARVDLPLLKATARAYRWSDDLVSGRVRSIGEIAKREHLTGRHVRHVMQLAFLAPRIVKAIAEGRQPADLTTLAMTQRIDLPPLWRRGGIRTPETSSRIRPRNSGGVLPRIQPSNQATEMEREYSGSM
jgi:hypothetical protein